MWRATDSWFLDGQREARLIHSKWPKPRKSGYPPNILKTTISFISAMKYSLPNQILPSEGLGQKMEEMGEECCTPETENAGSFNVPPLYEEK